MIDVLIAGAGPAGAIAGLVLARAGVRVLIVDRETFPRDKLCGDTLNPGAIALLGRLGITGGPLGDARPLAGMVLTDERRAVPARYPDGQVGRAITRRVLDAWLLDLAIRAGAKFEERVMVRGAVIDETAGLPRVRGLRVDRRGSGGPSIRLPSLMTIGADGRRSVLAREMGLSSHPSRRRWAFGVYASGIADLGDLGEMHVRRGHYFGIAPLTDTLANICVVTGPRPPGPRPMDVIRRTVGTDERLRDRMRDVRYESPVSVLGPLAVDVRSAGVDGLLLAGDAAGFVDPMTGDGLRLAMCGAVLAAETARRALETGDTASASARLFEARREVLAAKLRFNRAVRALMDSPAALGLVGWGAAAAPAIVGRLVRYAGDAA
jgi:flavin-dependent dehydrogenase